MNKCIGRLNILSYFVGFLEVSSSFVESLENAFELFIIETRVVGKGSFFYKTYRNVFLGVLVEICSHLIFLIKRFPITQLQKNIKTPFF